MPIVDQVQASGRQSNGCPSKRPAAFTLIELLVVVAIIGLLVSIMVPALGKARDVARVTVNLSNLKSMGLGVMLYLADNNGYFFVHEGNYNAPGNFSDDLRINTDTFSDAAALVADGLVRGSDDGQ